MSRGLNSPLTVTDPVDFFLSPSENLVSSIPNEILNFTRPVRDFPNNNNHSEFYLHDYNNTALQKRRKRSKYCVAGVYY